MATTAQRRGSMSKAKEEEPQAEDEVVETSAEEEPEPERTEEEEAEYGVTEPDPEASVFPDGPSFAQIEDWKKEFGKVYITSFGPDEHYIWRTLTRFEYRGLIKNIEQIVSSGQVSQAEANLNNEELIFEICSLFPHVRRDEISAEMAGVASIIAQEVMEASGFVAMEIREL